MDGEIFSADAQFTEEDTAQMFQKLPEEVYNPTVNKRVFTQWISDCSGAFIKPPTVEKCLANMEALWDNNAPVATMTEEESSESWTLQWIPTRISVDMPRFQIYWAPCYKVKAARIPELGEDHQDDKIITTHCDVQLQQDNTRFGGLGGSDNGDWLQEVKEEHLPLAEGPTLRFDSILDSQREKYRHRVREARIRAKLARYRAERLAQRYEERFGEYPEEDDEEAQTEAERSDED